MNEPEDPTSATAMASGFEGGRTTRLGPGDLAPDEERLLAALERDARTPAPAVAEELPRPTVSGPPDDGLTPTFIAPGGD
ncbi:hypothetical protein [Blastococcus sp. LR1]|uniref:hypothetical protein n=1 Tax=Blastococcus sp. LR1 TaxID=2877000 RepID=UPI001CCE13FF|nr:hypothetical protein [Blastococcus sp. LR1]MCA0144176.1 hypothetical protein [Blastococcus sp. LR1]